MEGVPLNGISETLDALYRSSSRQVYSTPIRLLGDFDAAEEAMHEAFAAAAETWPSEGVPANPRARLVSAGRFKTIDDRRTSTRRRTGLRTGSTGGRPTGRPITPTTSTTPFAATSRD